MAKCNLTPHSGPIALRQVKTLLTSKTSSFLALVSDPSGFGFTIKMPNALGV